MKGVYSRMKIIKRGLAVLAAVLLIVQPLAMASEVGEEETLYTEESTTAAVTESVEEEGTAKEITEKESMEESATDPDVSMEGMGEAEAVESTEHTEVYTDEGSAAEIESGEEAEITTDMESETHIENTDNGVNANEETSAVVPAESETEAVSMSESGNDTSKETEGVVYADAIASGSYKNINWVIDADGTLRVSGEGDFQEGGYDRAPWYNHREYITSAVIKVSGMTDASFMFYGCFNLINLDVSGFDTGNVTNMGGMFWGCSNLSNLDVSGFDTRNVTNMCDIFLGCSSLSNLDVSGFDTGNVTYMWKMFSGCSNLSNLTRCATCIIQTA